MPGIVGIISSSTITKIDVWLKNMISPIAQESSYIIKECITSNCGIANIALPAQKGIFAEKDSHIFVMLQMKLE